MPGRRYRQWLFSILVGCGVAAEAQPQTMAALPAAPGPRRTVPAGSQSSHYFARGFDLEQGGDFALSVDGIPLNLPSTVRGSGVLDLGLLIGETLGGLRYHRGPYRADQGAFASAGSAQLESDADLEGALRVTYGGADSDRFGRLLYTGRDARGLSWALEGSHSYRPWNEWSASSKFDGLLRFRPEGGGWGLTLLAMEEQADGGSASPARALPGDFEETYGDLHPGDGVQTRRLYLGLQKASVRGAGVSDHLQVFAGAAGQRNWADNTFFLRDTYWGDQIEQVDRRVFCGFEARRQWLRQAGSVHWEHRLGLQGRWDAVTEASVHASYDRDRIRPLLEGGADLLHAAPYGQSTARWGDGWRAFAGARLDSQWNQLHGANPNRDRSATLVSPKLGLAYSPEDGTEFRASWGQGFRPGNAVLGEQPMFRLKSADLTAQTRVLGPWETSVTLWRLDLEADTVFDPLRNARVAAPAARHQGLEWYHQIRWGGWNLEACMGWSKARFQADGARVPGSLPRTSLLALGWKGGGWAAEAKLRSLGAYALTGDGASQARRQEAIDLKLERDWAAWSAAVVVSNAFNRQTRNQEFVYVSRLPNEARSGVLERHLKTADPQAIRIELRRRF
jgi:outer membrane receptor protein involved in Fe transport